MQRTIGQLLKERRTKLDWSLDQAEKLTSIRKIYISALETDNYMAMPGPFYARAYLKQYAQRLDLNTDAILEAYDNGRLVEVEGPMEDTGNYRFIRPDERRSELGEDFNFNEENGNDVEKGPFRRYLAIILLSSVAIIILIAVALIVFLNQNNSPHISEENYQFAHSGRASDSSTTTSAFKRFANISKSGDTTVVQTNSKENPIRLSFTLKARIQSTTISIADTKGKQQLSLTSEGEKAEILLPKDANQVMITYSNADPVTIEVNGIELAMTAAQSSSKTIKLEINYK